MQYLNIDLYLFRLCTFLLLPLTKKIILSRFCPPLFLSLPLLFYLFFSIFLFLSPSITSSHSPSHSTHSLCVFLIIHYLSSFLILSFLSPPYILSLLSKVSRCLVVSSSLTFLLKPIFVSFYHFISFFYLSLLGLIFCRCQYSNFLFGCEAFQIEVQPLKPRGNFHAHALLAPTSLPSPKKDVKVGRTNIIESGIFDRHLGLDMMIYISPMNEGGDTIV